ncbi:MAG: trigger factor, partial [Eubacteriales bacterium]|nr:trigger factor [Eubacteriales bacterium]
ILTLCIAFAGTACGTKEKAAEETKTSEEKTEDKKDAEKSGEATRLVSVKDIDKYITIGQYKGLSLEKVVETITDTEVEGSISQDLEMTKEEVKDGVVEDGDTVTVNYVGTENGKEFNGGSAENQEITIGSGGYIPGFEDGILGMKKGETKDVPLTFPEDYIEPSLAGKDVVFKITLQSFKRAPELNDDWVAKNTEYKTVEEYREGKKKLLQENAEKMADSILYQTAWNQIYEASEVKEYPEKDVKEAYAEFETQIKSYAKQGGMELEDYLESQKVSQEAFEEQCQKYAEARVKQNLILQGIMDAEGMTLEDKESLAIQDELIQSYGAKDLASLVDTYGQVSVDITIGLIRVERFIVENANVEEKISENGTVGVSGNGSVSAEGEEAVEETEDTGEADSEETDSEETPTVEQ